jgi:hypothetical protein
VAVRTERDIYGFADHLGEPEQVAAVADRPDPAAAREDGALRPDGGHGEQRNLLAVLQDDVARGVEEQQVAALAGHDGMAGVAVHRHPRDGEPDVLGPEQPAGVVAHGERVPGGQQVREGGGEALPGAPERDVGVGGAPVGQEAALAAAAEDVQVVVGGADVGVAGRPDLGLAQGLDGVGLLDLRAPAGVEARDVEGADLHLVGAR